MRIGELEDAVGKELSSRRSQLTGELARLPERLAEPAAGATAPAVPLLDSVHISPEARAVQFGRPPGPFPPDSFPGPGEVVSILQDIDSAPGSARAIAGLQRLAALATDAARSLQAGTFPAGQPLDRRAAAIVAALRAYAAARPGSAAQTREVVLLIREMLGAMATAASSKGVAGAPAPSPASRFEQAAGAILLAALHAGREAATASTPARPGELPPALLSMLGSENRVPVRPKVVRRKPKERDRNRADEPTDDPADEAEGEPGAPFA